jgi:hypothetical protein
MTSGPSRPLRRRIGAVRSAARRDRRTRHVLLAATVIGLLSAPFAAGQVTAGMAGGQRNPSNDPSTGYQRETEIVGNIAQNQGGVAANTGGYTTRQSNKSDTGGGAIYGCRAKAGSESCVAANNLANGDAFRFQASPSAAAVGQIRFGINPATPVDKPPFTTNGTGLVKNLNADRVDGKSAEDFVDTGQLLFAAVAPDGAIGAHRGVPANAKATVAGANGNQVVTVPFDRDVTACTATATPTSLDATKLAVSAGPTKTTIVVSEEGAKASGFHLQVVC